MIATQTWDRFGSKAEIEGLFRELQRRNLHFLYQRTTELWMPCVDGCYGHCCIVKNIHSDFHTPLPLSQEDKQYPLAGLRFLFVFLDNTETHKGKQADQDFETDQFIKDQGSISLRYPYSGELSESHAREIVDEIQRKLQEALLT
ncbi:hypothetical protein MUP05_06550 [Candidatus Bathyarchaeota archaeon]|nr:hypothetical protein [Candidatus Bathyarchaeota archaeon]